MNVVRDAPQRQDDVSEIQYRWTAAQRVLLLEDKLDCLVTVLARLPLPGASPAPDVEPWPQPVDGAALLERLGAFETEYLVLPPGAADYLAVFALVTHATEAFHVAPYVAVLSPTNECGKTRLLEGLGLGGRRPWRPL